jgi:hypothetical protein
VLWWTALHTAKLIHQDTSAYSPKYSRQSTIDSWLPLVQNHEQWKTLRTEWMKRQQALTIYQYGPHPLLGDGILDHQFLWYLQDIHGQFSINNWHVWWICLCFLIRYSLIIALRSRALHRVLFQWFNVPDAPICYPGSIEKLNLLGATYLPTYPPKKYAQFFFAWEWVDAQLVEAAIGILSIGTINWHRWQICRWQRQLQWPSMSTLATNGVEWSYNDAACLTFILWAYSLVLLHESRSRIRLCMSRVLSAKLTAKHLSIEHLIHSWSTICMYALVAVDPRQCYLLPIIQFRSPSTWDFRVGMSQNQEL